jgi:hypothetical protein
MMEQEHDVREVAIRIIATLAHYNVSPDVGMGALATALIISAKQKGFTDEQMVDIFESNIRAINEDMARAKK